MKDLYRVAPTTVESLAFEMIDDYKQPLFKTILDISKDRPKLPEIQKIKEPALEEN